MKKILTILPLAVLIVLTGCTADKESNVTTDLIASGVVHGGEDGEVSEVQKVDNLDTSEWEAYVNEEYGFTIAHPKGIHIQEVPDFLDSTYFRFFKECDDSIDCVKFGVAIYPNGRFQEALYKSELSTGFNFSDRAVTVVTDPKLPSQTLFMNIMQGDGDECDFENHAGTSSGIRFNVVPDNWSKSDHLFSFSCSDREHADILKGMLKSFSFL